VSLRSTGTEWGFIASWLHWVMALLIIGLMILGWTARSWPVSPFKVSLFFWHKSIGILVLALAVARMFLHLIDRRPTLPVMSATERFLARCSHLMLYTLMLVMPLSGWVINSAAKFPFMVFGLFRLPTFVAADKTLAEAAKTAHFALFWIFFTLIAIHVAAALRHEYRLKNGVLHRMLPVTKYFRSFSESENNK